MREEQIHIPTWGSTAFTRLWNTKKKELGMVLIVHDLAEHSARYQNFALFLAHHGYSVLAYDLRGHGYSALQKNTYNDPHNLKKILPENPEFGYMPPLGGWQNYLEDFNNVLQYMISCYRMKRNFIFGHGMGSMIAASALSMLSATIFQQLSGILLSAPPVGNERQHNLILRKINIEIKHHGAQVFSPRIDKMIFGKYSTGRNLFSNRTEQDWISSQAEEVDLYISDPLCGNVLRLGLYKTMMEGKKTLYAKNYHLGADVQPLPLFLFSGSDDPASGYGRGGEQLNELFRRHGWQDREIQQYPGRHDLLHDRSRVKVYEECLAWMEKQE